MMPLLHIHSIPTSKQLAGLVFPTLCYSRAQLLGNRSRTLKLLQHAGTLNAYNAAIYTMCFLSAAKNQSSRCALVQSYTTRHAALHGSLSHDIDEKMLCSNEMAGAHRQYNYVKLYSNEMLCSNQMLCTVSRDAV